MKVYTTTPADGETEAAEFTCKWKGHRIRPTTVGFAEPDSGAWQFQIAAECDWVTSQSFMLAVVALKVGDQRWKVTKVEKPVGVSLVWKLRAQMQ